MQRFVWGFHFSARSAHKDYRSTSDNETIRYPEWRRIYIERLTPALSRDPEAKLAFQTKLSAYFCGELPHCKDIIISTLLYLLDGSTIHDTGDMLVDDYYTIMRVSCPWPGRTKEALRRSLDNGIFDNFELEIVRVLEASIHLVYLAPAVMDDVILSPHWRCEPQVLAKNRHS